MARRQPEGLPPLPVVQRLRLQYAKRGRLRFTSHRDFARAFERALRRADVPMAYSAGFTPHPRISYVGAAPTGMASEAEYLEIGLARRVDPAALVQAVHAALPDGLDIVAAVEASSGSLTERITASVWRITWPDLHPDVLRPAVEAFLAATSAPVERLTKDGRRIIDARPAVVRADVLDTDDSAVPAAPPASQRRQPAGRAILELVVRQVTPAVRPDDVLAALRSVGGLALDVAPGSCWAVRLAQGPLDGNGLVGDPLAADRAALPSL
jgi:radical SAM-linked protein